MEFCRISPDVKLGTDVKIFAFVNLYGCSIGDNTKVGTFVEIQKNAFIGRNCKISSHTFICEGVTIEDDVWIGAGAIITDGASLTSQWLPLSILTAYGLMEFHDMSRVHPVDPNLIARTQRWLAGRQSRGARRPRPPGGWRRSTRPASRPRAPARLPSATSAPGRDGGV